MLSALPERIEAALNRLKIWQTTFRHALVETALYLKERLVQWVSYLRQHFEPRGKAVWNARGFKGNFVQILILAFATPVLYGCMVFSLYADSLIMVKGLNALFGIESSLENSHPAGGVATSLLERSGEQRGEGSNPEPTSATVSNLLRRLLNYVANGFKTLWEGEKLGFLAIALAALQAGFGLVLFWQTGLERPLRVRPLELLRERPVVTSCFLIMNLALCLLAANRGFELSSEAMGWAMPVFVSGGLSLVMPWILTYCLHYAIEGSAQYLGLAAAILLNVCMFVGVLAVITAWALALSLVLVAVSAAFGAFLLFDVLATSLLLFAQLLGDFFRTVRRPADPGFRPASLAISGLLIILTLAASGLLIRGLL
jgi:hypothetical protein